MPKVPKITSLQYLGNREVRDKFIFLHEDKHQRLFEGDTLAFGGHSQAFPERPKQEVCNTICYILRKKEGVKLFFLYADKQTLLQVNSINIGKYGQ